MNLEQEHFKNFMNSTKEYSSSKTDKHYLKLLEQVKPYSRVLILGCGAGREIKELLKKHCEIVAVEISLELADYCFKTYSDFNVRVVCCNALDFETDEKFDYVLGLDAFLNFIPYKKDRIKMLKKINKWTGLTGKFIYTIRKPECFLDWLKILFWFPFTKEFGTVMVHGKLNKHLERIPYYIFISDVTFK